MPLRRNQDSGIEDKEIRAKLAAAISEELGSPEKPGASIDPEAPLIIEEPLPPPGKLFAVTVLWDDRRWKALDVRARASVILEAYGMDKDRKGDIANITRALGLTRAEAEKLGIGIEG